MEYLPGHRGGMAIQGALLFALAQAQGPNFDHLNKANLHLILEMEILPDNYNPTANQVFNFDEETQSNDLREQFRDNVELAICDFCSNSTNTCVLE